MKPEAVKKALTDSDGHVTIVLSDASSLTVERGAWSIVGKTFITKSKGKDLLLSTDKITKIEPAKQSVPVSPPIPAHSRIFIPKRGP